MRPAVALPVLLLALAAGVAPACRGGSSKARGGTRATAAGRAPAPYPDLASAKAAFTRSGGAMTALLLDAAWIRLEPDSDQAEARHPDYFQGFTCFHVTTETQHFTRPTEETFLLEDSSGASLTAKPVSYKSDVQRGFGPKHLAAFDLTFRHAMSRDLRWVRLTRQGEGGGTLEWALGGD